MIEVERYKSEEIQFNSYMDSIEKILIAKDNLIHKFIDDVLYN